jgi:aryl-alcohol dehydrogenase-like predicted oxidoreductase
MSLSRIGFGTLSISGIWSQVTEKEGVYALHSALDKGINWIDTSPIYGNAEKIIGKALKLKRDNAFIASKCGILINQSKQFIHNLSTDSLDKELTSTLKKLNISELDLYQCHAPDLNIPVEITWSKMADFVHKGLVKHIGLCNYPLLLIKKLQPIYPIYSIQLPYNMLRKTINADLSRYCLENNIKILTYSPLQSGLLSGKFSPNNLDINDKRLLRKDLSCSNKLKPYQDFIDSLRPIAENMQISIAQLAISWILQNKNISSTVVGMRTKENITENMKCLSVHFNETNKLLIKKLISRLPKL